MKKTLFALLMLFVCAVPAMAQDPAHEPDEEGCVDSKLISRMKGCRILSCDAKDFDAYDIVIGRDAENDDWKRRTLEGKIDKVEYVCAANLSALQIARNMENALKSSSLKVVSSVRDGGFYYITANRGAQWLEIMVGPWNSQSHYEVTSVVVQEMEQEVVADASGMAAAINASGSVAIYGITFDTGKATFQPGSEQILGEIVKLMNENPDWKFEVQGHTDNVGQKAANMTLSEQRAAAVVNWLTMYGIDKARLVARGYGDTMPVADNSSEEGRAKNRRVELKKIN